MIKFYFLFNIYVSILFSQDIIDFAIKGIDDGVRTSRDKDYKEALIDAKRKIIEKAGIEIKSTTEIKNFQLIEDYIESKSEGIILPGMIIEDLGYNEKGTYQVFLVGKLKTTGETISNKKLRYAESLFKRQKISDTKEELNNIIQNSNDDDLIAEAMYLKIKWNLCDNINEEFERLKAYYPGSIFVEKSKKMILIHKDRSLKAKNKKVPIYFKVRPYIKGHKEVETDFLSTSRYEGVGCYSLYESKNHKNPFLHENWTCDGYDKKSISKQFYANFNKDYVYSFYAYCWCKDNGYTRECAYKDNVTFTTPNYDENIKSFIFEIYIDKGCQRNTKVIPIFK